MNIDNASESITYESPLEILRKHKAILSGSFILSSGKISDTYVQLNSIMSNPHDFSMLCGHLARKLHDTPGFKCDAILSPALGALIVGYDVAKYLGVKYMFCERDESRQFALRRGFTVDPKDALWIVENVVTTGASALEAASLARSCGANVVGIASIIDRGGGAIIGASGLSFISIVEVQGKEYTRENAPPELLINPIKPGSR